MTTTIPRAELDAIARRHDMDYDIGADPPIERVRELAAYLRGGGAFGPPVPAEVIAEADDLDTLADRYEKEAAR